MRRLMRAYFLELLLIPVILFFGVFIPLITWLEERNITSVLQSFAIFAVFLILFLQNARQKSKEFHLLSMIIFEIQTILNFFYNNKDKLQNSEIQEKIKNEFKLIAQCYKEELKYLHIFIPEPYNHIIIRTFKKRFEINLDGIKFSEIGKKWEDITANKKKHDELINKLYEWFI